MQFNRNVQRTEMPPMVGLARRAVELAQQETAQQHTNTDKCDGKAQKQLAQPSGLAGPGLYSLAQCGDRS